LAERRAALLSLELGLTLLVADPLLEAFADRDQHPDQDTGEGDRSDGCTPVHQILSSTPRSASIWWAMSCPRSVAMRSSTRTRSSSRSVRSSFGAGSDARACTSRSAM